MGILKLFNSVIKSKEIGDIFYKNIIQNPKSNSFSYTDFKEKYFYTLSKGLTIYGPELCHLINIFNAYFRTAKVFNDFIEMAFPRLLTENITNNFELEKLWPYYLFRVSTNNPSNYSKTSTVKEGVILDPVQCPWFYEILAKNFDKIRLPFKVREILGGWSYRNESMNKLIPLEKDLTFLRTEFMFAGNMKDVKKTRIELICKMMEYLKMIKIPHRAVIGNGCYDSMPKLFSKRLSDSVYYSDVPVIDIEAYLPYKDKWLEIVGASYFGSDKIDNFTTTSAGIQTGCVGVGISRLALAFLANNSLNKKNWPEVFINE